MYKYRLFHCNNSHKVHTAPSIKIECNYKINNVAKIFLYFFRFNSIMLLILSLINYLIL